MSVARAEYTLILTPDVRSLERMRKPPSGEASPGTPDDTSPAHVLRAMRRVCPVPLESHTLRTLLDAVAEGMRRAEGVRKAAESQRKQNVAVLRCATISVRAWDALLTML